MPHEDAKWRLMLNNWGKWGKKGCFIKLAVRALITASRY